MFKGIEQYPYVSNNVIRYKNIYQFLTNLEISDNI